MASILKQLTPEQKIKLIGEIASLMIASDIHVLYHLEDIRDIFLPAVDCNQFLIYRNKEKFPVGFVCWAFLSDKIEKLYEEGKYKLKPQDWQSGDNGWIIELIAPYGHGKTIISELRTNVFANKKGHALVFSKDRKDLRKIMLRGQDFGKTKDAE